LLIYLFSSHTRVKLLTLFLSNPNRSFFVREISRKIGERINSVRRELDNLLQIELLLSYPEKNKIFYKANTNFLIFPELKSIIQKTTDAKDDLAEKFREVGDVYFAVMTGIFTGNSSSPTDLLIVCDNTNRGFLQKMLDEMEEEVSDTIRYTVLSVNDYNLRESLGDRFLNSIMNGDKIIVIDERHKKNFKR